MLFSSQLLGKTKVDNFFCPDPAPSFQLTFSKPDAECYTKALELMQVAPSEAIMIAAHAYDLRAARTVYVSFLCNGSFGFPVLSTVEE